MRQLTCVGPGKIEWRDVPDPVLEHDTDALVRPIAVARCDLDPFLTAGLFPTTEPFALGHEAIAEVVALGDRVRGLKIGQRVAASFQVSCGSCRFCTSGRSAVCAEYPPLSDFGMQPLSGVEYGGMLADRVRVPHAQTMLHAVPAGLDPVAIASAPDNIMDGYRSVAPHLAERPGSRVLVASHRPRASISLYAVQVARALGAERVDFACADPDSLRAAEKLGAHPIETDFARVAGTWPIVVDDGLTPEGFQYAIRATEPGGTCHSVAFYKGHPRQELNLSRLYTLGIRFEIGRAQSASMLPEVLAFLASGRMRPEEVTTRVVAWDDAAEAYAEPSIKLVVARDA